ncbi:hypothetical protein [uncultured Roseobacter sp.]|uniref:hypothetical protein n=1 Tax=uncultured Roseobacter sp. TaxID=114847 RepID=UPI00262AA2B0|nr:hypothetical protein [uncultured Roseobacter sp.]
MTATFVFDGADLAIRKLQIRLYGSFSCRWDTGQVVDVRGAKHRALIALLATAPNGTHTRSWIQDTLWRRAGEEHGRASLRRSLSDIRKVFGDDFDRIFKTTNAEIQLSPNTFELIGNHLDGEFAEGINIPEEGFTQWVNQKRKLLNNDFSLSSQAPHSRIAPKIAIVPFATRHLAREEQHLSDLVAQEVSRSLSRSRLIRVISHLSSRRVDGTLLDISQIREALEVDYVVYGTVGLHGDRYMIDADLVQTANGHIEWTRQISGRLADLLSNSGDLLDLCSQIGHGILSASVEMARGRAPGDVESHVLLMSAVSNMHQHRLAEFARARSHLEELISRTPANSELHAWLGKWYVLSIAQGWSTNPQLDSRNAIDSTKRALDCNPRCPLSLTFDGMIRSSDLANLSKVEAQFDWAVEIDPNNSLAWLMYSRLHMFDGNGELALRFAERACELSPIDPYGYFFDIIRASALSICEDYVGALDLAEKSIAANPRHTSSHRVKVIALALMGRCDEAATAAKLLTRLEPGLTIEGYLRNHPAGDRPMTRKWADALKEAGVPVQ